MCPWIERSPRVPTRAFDLAEVSCTEPQPGQPESLTRSKFPPRSPRGAPVWRETSSEQASVSRVALGRATARVRGAPPGAAA
jgi:hypothetical protein